MISLMTYPGIRKKVKKSKKTFFLLKFEHYDSLSSSSSPKKNHHRCCHWPNKSVSKERHLNFTFSFINCFPRISESKKKKYVNGPQQFHVLLVSKEQSKNEKRTQQYTRTVSKIRMELYICSLILNVYAV